MKRYRQHFPNSFGDRALSCFFFILLSPILVPLVAAVLLGSVAYRMLLLLSVWVTWCTQGRDVLVVYSNSPIWQPYIEQTLLPHLKTRAVVLNWSDRKEWHRTLATAIFHRFGGRQNFNPIVIVFRPFRRTTIFRFAQPFQDYKHGKPESLERLEAELFTHLSIPPSPR